MRRGGRRCPPGHARRLAAATPGAELRRYHDEGHLSLYGRDREVLDWLARQIPDRR